MWIELEHRTAFRYDGPVVLEPLDVRLQPRSDSSQRLARFALEIDPRPAGLSAHEDVQGNAVTRAWFEGRHEALTITTRAVVETLRSDPFAYLLEPAARRLPFVAGPELQPALAPFTARDEADPAVTGWAAGLAREAGQETVPFLAALARRLHEGWRQVVRPESDPWPAAVTMAERQGACRDLAVLYLDACRALGLGGRFVSGYHATSPPDGKRALHAWCEVYLPGAGWRGFDPTEGLAVADRHVAVAAGPRPRDAAPTAGTFRGRSASTLEAEIQLQVRAERPASTDGGPAGS